MVALRVFSKVLPRLELLYRKLSEHRPHTCVRKRSEVFESRIQAVSDGELNMSKLSSGGSSHSLGPSGVRSSDGVASQVVSWAVGFEKLLEDPTGVEYFTAFLKSEVSAENILFWQACEKFRQIPENQVDELKKEARLIYDAYLSDSSFDAVNIDDTARVDESAVEHPTTGMFQKAQDQIFKLMKFDSYARFVRSPLYQGCMVACVEGKALPSLGISSKGSRECITPTTNRKKELDTRLTSSDSKTNRRKRLEKRGSWGADVSFQRVGITRNESQISVKSTSSVELGYMHYRSENGRATLWDADLFSAGGSSPIAGQAEKYCYVHLPDGTGSLVPTKPGYPLRDMLGGLCDKRGFPLKDVIIYLHGNDKQPLSLEQDSSVLSDQQVSLEVRVTLAVEVKFTGKTIGIVAKSSKTLREALASLLLKHNVHPQDALVTMSGSQQPLKLNTSVFRLANKTICLDRSKGNGMSQDVSQKAFARPSKPYDMDGLLEILSRAQSNRVEDQRGLLRKEHLVLPQFLQLSEEAQGSPEEQSLTPDAQGERGCGLTGQGGEGEDSQPAGSTLQSTTDPSSES